MLKLIVRLWPFLILLALALFPFGWLGQVWPGFGEVLWWVFPSEGRHDIGHATLFGLLGLLLLIAFPSLRGRPWLYFCLILLAGIGEETFQVIYKGGLNLPDTLGDLSFDLIGALITLIIFSLWQRQRTLTQARQAKPLTFRPNVPTGTSRNKF